jgi:hypothetical protein
MDYSQLDMLMTVSKKGDASKDKKNQFNNLLKSYILENGYTDQAEKYLFDGFSFCGATPIFEIMINKTNTDDRLAIFMSISNGKLFCKNEKGITFKLLISLLGNLMKARVEDMALFKSIITKIPGYSKNKEGKYWGDISKTVEKYFVCVLTENSLYPDLESLDLKPALIEKFSLLMTNSLKCDSKNKNNFLVVQKILAWLSACKEENIFATETKEEKLIVATNEKTKSNKNKADELRNIANYLADIEAKFKDFQKKYEALQDEKNALESIVKKKDILIRKLQDDLKETETLKEQYSSKVSALQYEIKDNMAKIEDLTNELQKRNSVLSVFESDKQNSHKEHLNSIASQLKAEYKDFIDALDMEMTIDLGENMRQQISTIFKILSKNGIDVERRL